MSRKGIAFLIAFTMLFSIIVIVMEIAPNVEGLTIYVDDDYGSEDPTHKKSIVSAIENANNGDTIIVYDGEYNGKFGEIYIDKSVDIIGESFDSTILNETWLHFGTNYVNLSYFRIHNCTVDVGGVSNIGFNYCNFSQRDSIDITSSSNILISNSTISGNEGIYSDESINIAMWNTTILTTDYYGINIYGSQHKYYNHSIATSNTVNGKQVYYYYNVSNLLLNNLDAGHITLASCSNITISDSNVTGGDGITIAFSSGLNFDKCNISSNLVTGIYMRMPSNFNNFTNTIVSNNKAHGFRLMNSKFNTFFNITLDSNDFAGFYLSSYADNNTVTKCNLTNNDWGFIVRGEWNIVSENEIKENNDGIWLFGSDSKNNYYINNSLNNTNDDFFLAQGANGFVLNSSFNKSKVGFEAFVEADDFLVVQWYLHVKLVDNLGNPVSNANVKIEDNLNGSYNQTFVTDSNGYIKWIPITEYIEKDEDTNWIGEKTYYTPHKIVAWNDTLVGYAESTINESKTITIILYNGTFMDLEPGWNLISLPRIQSDTNLQTVLQSIDGQYDAVQWYNIVDTNDHWKHYHVSKPSKLNDLSDINHTMGFWIYVTNPNGTTLIVKGDVITSPQNITLYPGWNQVGYPSTTDKTRILALNNVLFDTDVDAIWTHNATSQKWKEITASDNFEVGRGYWIHSKVTKTWTVPL
jgi:parallel beta-helix repeat protein